MDKINFPHVHSDQALHLAVERMSAEQLDLLPVVSRANIHKLEGVVTLHYIFNSIGIGKYGSA